MVPIILTSVVGLVAVVGLAALLYTQWPTLSETFDGGNQRVVDADTEPPADADAAQVSGSSSSQSPPTEASEPVADATPSPDAPPVRPDPIEIVISDPKVVRKSYGKFEVELQYSTVGDYQDERTSSRLKASVRRSDAFGWSAGRLNLSFFPKVMDGPEGTIRQEFELTRTDQTLFLDELSVDWEFQFWVTYSHAGTESRSNTLVTTGYEFGNVETFSVQELIERFGGYGEGDFGDIVTIVDVPTFTSVDRNGNGYVVFNHGGGRVVDCFFTGPGGVNRSDRGKTVTIRGMIGRVTADRIAIMSAYYLEPPKPK